jgi:class I fructose-bisphosphate aldolase
MVQLTYTNPETGEKRTVDEMDLEFDKIEEEAHKKGLPVIAWIYPRGRSIQHKSKSELMAYAARTGLEIGADIVKLVYNGDTEDLKWAIKASGKTKVVIAGGTKTDEFEFLENVREIIDAGGTGIAVGRNVWQAKDPLKVTMMIKKIIWK